MSSAPWLSTITQFFSSLEKHTGIAGFEGLVARLLEGATGQRFRLASSGFQAGLDARSEPGGWNQIKVEAKHYTKTRLNRSDLITKISEATGEGSDVDLWVLATSCQINNQLASELERLASERHIEALFLDCGIDGLPRLAVLMAALPNVVESWAEQNNISFSLDQLRIALEQIASNLNFEPSWHSIRRRLTNTLLGYEDARRRSKAQFLETMRDLGNTEAKFAQRVAMRSEQVQKIVRLEIHNQLITWWTEPFLVKKHGVVLGEEGAGKTWAVMNWITDQIEADLMPIVLPFSASTVSISDGESIENFLPKLLAKWTGLTNELWDERMRRWLAAPGSGKPLFLIIADGLNEKPLVDWPLFFRTLEDKRWRQHVAVLITDRPGHWIPNCAKSGLDSFQDINIEGYTDWELQQVLQGKKIAFDSIPHDLKDLIKSPRYCNLVCEHFEEITAANDFTRERLIFLDVLHRTRLKRGVLTEDTFIEIIKNLALRYRQDPTIPLSDVQKLLPTRDPDGRIHQEIIDGGLLVPQPGIQTRFSVEHTRLVFGLGMLLADEIGSNAKNGAANAQIESAISEWFEPEREMDIKVEICGAALFHSLIDSSYPAIGRRELLRYWLTLRNWNDTAQQAFLDYIVRCPEDFIAVTEEFWSSKRDYGAAQDFLGAAFIKYRDDVRLQSRLAAAVNKWMGFIHPAGYPFFRSNSEREQKARGEIKGRVGCVLTNGPVEIAGQKLTVIADDGLLRLKRLAFRLMSAGPRRPFAHSLVPWAVAAAIMGTPVEADVADWVVHLAEDEFDDLLLPEIKKLLQHENLIATRAARTLLWWSDAGKANELWEKDPNPDYIYLHDKHKDDPCTSLLAWSDQDCLKCMERQDVSLHMILQSLRNRLLNPEFTVPASLIERAGNVLAMDPSKFRTGLWSTVADHEENQVITILASRSPKTLANFIRKVVTTALDRTSEAVYALAIWLPDVALLFTKTELDTLGLLSKRLQDSVMASGGTSQVGPGKDSDVEAFVFLAIAPHLTPAELFRALLHRPEAATDLLRFEPWFNELPSNDAAAAFSALHSAVDDLTLIRALWFLANAGIELTSADRHRIVLLAQSKSARVRGGAMRFAVMSNDEPLGRDMINLTATYEYDGNAWDSIWGPQVLIQYSRCLTFTSLASQLHPSELGYALSSRGFLPDDVAEYAAILDEHWRIIMAAADPDLLRLPTIVSKSDQIDPRQRFPKFVEEDSDVSFRNPTVSWGALRPTNLIPDEFNDPEAAVAKRNRLSRERAETIHAAWRTGALQWFGRSFSQAALQHICRDFPDLVTQWVQPALLGGWASRAIQARLGTFLAQICSILLDENAKLGFELWTALQSGRSGPVIFDAAQAAFAASDNPLTSRARWSILNDCNDDAAIARVAFLAEQNGRQLWLFSTTEQLLAENRIWKRAKGLCLASYSNITIGRFDSYIAQAQLSGTWMESQVDFLRSNVLKNEFAQHWFRKFLEANDADVSWGALQMVLHCGDFRFFTWRSLYEDLKNPNQIHRLRFLEAQGSDLEKKLDREHDRKSTLFGISIPRGEIFPFTVK